MLCMNRKIDGYWIGASEYDTPIKTVNKLLKHELGVATTEREDIFKLTLCINITTYLFVYELDLILVMLLSNENTAFKRVKSNWRLEKPILVAYLQPPLS